MFTTSLKRAGLALAAITGLGLAGCGDDAAPEATFLPGDYVAGAVFWVPNVVAGKDLGEDDDWFGALEITVAEDGTITGTFTDYLYYYNPGDLPGEDVVDSAFDVSGTAEGTSFSVTLEDTPDDVEVVIEGTITPDGFLTGELSTEGESTGYVGGVTTNGENIRIACGPFSVSNGSGVDSSGGAAFLTRGDNELFGVVYDGMEAEFGVISGTFDIDEEEADIVLNGEFEDEDIADLEVSITYMSFGHDDDWLSINGGFTGEFTNSGFWANTEYCFDWDD